MASTIKRLLIAAYCHGWLGAAAVGWVFRHVDLRGK